MANGGTARSDDAADRDVIYLDYNATAPLRPAATAAMISALQTVGNAGSGHVLGQRAAAAVARAREQIAKLVGCSPSELIFTAGATEANNLALHTTLSAGGMLVVSAVEHPAVLEAADSLCRQFGSELRVIGVDLNGAMRLDDLHKSLAAGTPAVVSLMAANNETGVLTDLDAVGKVISDYPAILHSDITQMAGRLPVALSTSRVDMASISAHKFGGPQGVGALYVRRGLRIPQRPLVHGGGQERGWRAGTLNVAGIVGMGAAAEAVRGTLDDEVQRITRLRDRLEHGLLAALPGARANGVLSQRLPGVSSLTFPGTPADAVLAGMPDVAASNGSACASGALEPSHVLQAMGLSGDDADSTLRFSLGYATTEAEVDRAISRIVASVHRVQLIMSSV